MNCRFYRGDLSVQDRELLAKLLQQYDAKLILESWLKLNQVKKPSGLSVDSDKVHAVQIVKRSGAFCKKARVHVYPIETGCYLFSPRSESVQEPFC
jgi:hypothetical protein